MLNSQLIGGVMIDWDKIDRDSYLRNIDAISHVDNIKFTHSVTFFVGENGSGPMIPILNYAAQFAFPVVSGVPGTVIS